MTPTEHPVERLELSGPVLLRGREPSTTLLFPNWLLERYGSGWVVAPRLTRNHARKGYTLAISPADYMALEVE